MRRPCLDCSQDPLAPEALLAHLLVGIDDADNLVLLLIPEVPWLAAVLGMPRCKGGQSIATEPPWTGAALLQPSQECDGPRSDIKSVLQDDGISVSGYDLYERLRCNVTRERSSLGMLDSRRTSSVRVDVREALVGRRPASECRFAGAGYAPDDR